MYRIHNLNNISPKGTALWTENYTLTDAPQHVLYFFKFKNIF